MTQFILVYITCESEAQAASIGHIIVEQGAAACANVFPQITSIYKWEGEIQSAEESVLIVKTRASLLPKVQEIVTELHSYANPCVISMPINGGNPTFLKWIEENTINP
jgi:periplasmic divalent cation tolerance protein